MNFAQWLIREEEVGGNQIKVPLPSVRQSHNYDCGAAILRSVCEFFKVGPEDHKEFIKACKTGKKHGTDVEDMIRAARSFGLSVKPQTGMSLDDLKKYIDMRRPVIVCMQAWDETKQKQKNYKKVESGHYVAAIGYDDNYIYFEDPVLKGVRGILVHKEFDRRWIDKDADGKVYDHFGMPVWKSMGFEAPDDQTLTSTKKIP